MMENVNNNVLAPRLVALIKDYSLAMYLNKWQDDTQINTYKDIELIFKNNDIEKFDASCISIKNEFRAFSLPEIFDMVLTSKDCLEGIVKDTLRFVGRSNEGQPKEKIEW
jgi:hypothetical protein